MTVKGGLEAAVRCCNGSARAVCGVPVRLVNQRRLRATRWDSPPSFRLRPHNTLGYRPPGPRGRAFPTLAPQPLQTLALGAALNYHWVRTINGGGPDRPCRGKISDPCRHYPIWLWLRIDRAHGG